MTVVVVDVATTTTTSTKVLQLLLLCGGQSNHHKWLVSRKIWSVEKLEILLAGTKPRTSHHRSPGGDRHWKRKRQTIFLERTREGLCESDEHWNRFKGDVGETSKRLSGAHMDFAKAWIPSWTELNWLDDEDNATGIAYYYQSTIDDLRKSRGLHSVRAFGHGPVYIGPCPRV